MNTRMILGLFVSVLAGFPAATSADPAGAEQLKGVSFTATDCLKVTQEPDVPQGFTPADQLQNTCSKIVATLLCTCVFEDKDNTGRQNVCDHSANSRGWYCHKYKWAVQPDARINMGTSSVGGRIPKYLAVWGGCYANSTGGKGSSSEDWVPDDPCLRKVVKITDPLTKDGRSPMYLSKTNQLPK